MCLDGKTAVNLLLASGKFVNNCESIHKICDDDRLYHDKVTQKVSKYISV